jgi:hypothetical protein
MMWRRLDYKIVKEAQPFTKIIRPLSLRKLILIVRIFGFRKG